MSQAGCRGDLEFQTLPRMLKIVAERHGSRNAVEDGGAVLTYAQLAEYVGGAARALMAAGVQPGDRVAIWAPNCWEWMVVALGVHAAGGVLVPVNTRYKGAEAAWLLRKSGAKVLFTVNGFLGHDYVDMLRRVPGEGPAAETVIILRGDVPDDCNGFSVFMGWSLETPQAEADARAAAVSPDDLCDLLFTSGTTGHPKGAMATHAQTLRAYRDWADVVGLAAGDRYLVVVPFFHSFGYKAGFLAALMSGATVLPQATFDVDAVLKRIYPDRVTVRPGPPALYQTLLVRRDLAEYDLSSLRLAVTGAAVIPVALIRQMRDTLGFDTVITGYGLTEATGIVTMCRHDDDPETIATTSGRAIPGVEVTIVDAAGAALAPGEPGEVLVRGYNVTRGYFEDPEQTAAAIDGEGWLKTGDVGVMDARGYLRITDRIKDMFIVGGFNAYPAEIEDTLLGHPAVAHAAVIGAPDDRLGEVGVAFLVPREGAALDPAAVIDWCRERMANFKVPRQVIVVDDLPRNATGKVQKFVLRERLATL
jgi:acyl-CoA synthetase (AMP-forming)/AMP-acid ligase II